jgi:hypothetical protein
VPSRLSDRSHRGNFFPFFLDLPANENIICHFSKTSKVTEIEKIIDISVAGKMSHA